MVKVCESSDFSLREPQPQQRAVVVCNQVLRTMTIIFFFHSLQRHDILFFIDIYLLSSFIDYYKYVCIVKSFFQYVLLLII